MLLRTVTWLSMLSVLTSCALWDPKPKPCECSAIEAELYTHAADYATCLEDLGNARNNRTVK